MRRYRKSNSCYAGRKLRKGNGVSTETFRQAEKITRVRFTPPERAKILQQMRSVVGAFEERRKVTLTNDVSPAVVFQPSVGASNHIPFIRSQGENDPLPADPADIAFSPVTRLSRWIESGKLSSRDLIKIYLDRLKKIGPLLN